MSLVDGDDFVEICVALDGVVFSGRVARVIEALAHGAIEDVEDQRGFARAGYSRYSNQQARRQAHVDVLEVVLASAVDGDLVDDAQPGAGWAGPFRLIEGKMGHADLWDRLTTVRAGKGCFGRDGIVIRTDMP